MLTVVQLREISWSKLRAAEHLQQKREFDEATNLCGLAVEIGLKARVCVDQGLSGWPETDAEFAATKPLKLKTHDLEHLLLLTKLETHVKGSCLLEWGTCLQWRVETRYQPVGTATRSTVEEMMRSAEAIIRSLSAVPGLDVVSVSPTDPPFVKLWGLAQELEIEKGQFTLFALCNRTGSPESADLVVSARWIAEANSDDGAKYIAKRVNDLLNGDELKALSGLMVLDPTHFVVSRLTVGSIHVSGGQLWWQNPEATINGVRIGKALILKCRKWEP